MSKNKIIGALLGTGLCLFTVTSCKDITDLQPADAFSETTAFSTSQRVELSVIGMYNAAQSGTYAGNAVRGYPFGSANVQQSEMRGEDMLNQALFFAITNENTYTPFSANNVWMWNTLFTLVNQCNVTIEGVQKAATDGIITQEVALGYEGEARFLRALAYHELLTHFARPFADGNGSKPGMPIRDFAVLSPATVEKAIATGRSSVAENYTFILADLDFAETNLPATRAGNLRVFRSVKGAAIALKTRVKLHKQDWAGVLTEGNKIVTATAPFTSPISGFSLTPTAAAPFSNQVSNEAVFSIENNEQDNPGVNGSLAGMLGSPAVGGRGLIRISPVSYNLKEWPAADARRALLTKDARSYYTGKYTDYTNRSDNNPIIRYAEVILNVAEAEARTAAEGVSPRALELVNAIRGRGLASAVYKADQFATKVDFVKAILLERRIELLAEGRRWADIHRLALEPSYTTGGIPAKMAFGNATFLTYNLENPPVLNKTIPAIPYEDYRFLWPFPADEVSRNPTLRNQQNPGY